MSITRAALVAVGIVAGAAGAARLYLRLAWWAAERFDERITDQ